jgi:predicted transcriptional regulator
MALACEMDEKTVLSALEELIERGMLVLETREGLSPKYILTSPSSWKGKGR